MKTVIISGAAGLVGSESVRFFHQKGYRVAGIDNNMRKYFFGEDCSTKASLERLKSECRNFKNHDIDIRDFSSLDRIFKEYSSDIFLVIHAAAQPSHDWAAREPFTDFSVNATGTMNMLEATRLNCPGAVFIFTSSNKVYGDLPNTLPLAELETRWELMEGHPYFNHGIDENMPVDQSKHSLFGVSKLAADVMVQEYGKYFGIKTGVFRAGCITGPLQSGAQMHGFLSYLMKCTVTGTPYTVFGYKGKQVRDNIHSSDLVTMFWHFCQDPDNGEVYNAGGGRFSNCSMKEVILLCEKITGKKINSSYSEKSRNGDHIWYISDTTKFRNRYPGWQQNYNIQAILEDIYNSIRHKAQGTR